MNHGQAEVHERHRAEAAEQARRGHLVEEMVTYLSERQ
jgi:hypothetical protein